METTVELREKGQVRPFVRNDHADRWAAGCATAGAAVWAGMAVLARLGTVRIGAIELMFLFAPLVIVPLGMELGRVLGVDGRFERIARRWQPAGAALVVLAMCVPPGRRAAAFALGWMIVCGLMAGGGIAGMAATLWGDAGRSARATQSASTPSPSTPLTAPPFPESQGSTLARVTLAVARIDLLVGGAWLVASRLGMRPMGIQEPIGLLTAVHFHFAGFATAMIAAATLNFADRSESPLLAQKAREKWGTREPRWLRRVVILVLALPYLVAVGFVASPALKMTAALLFSASVAALAAFVRACGVKVEDATARVLLQVAAGAVFAGMVLSGTYAIVDFMKSEALTIPQMVRTHGILNAVGFCLPGLLGWLSVPSTQYPVPSTEYRVKTESEQGALSGGR